jgi:hypothetical protein
VGGVAWRAPVLVLVMLFGLDALDRAILHPATRVLDLVVAVLAALAAAVVAAGGAGSDGRRTAPDERRG